MRFTDGNNLLPAAVLVTLLLSATATCQPANTPAIITDPILGIAFDASRVRFDPGDDLLNRCPDLVNEKWTRRVFVFGRIHSGDADFVLAGGPMVQRTAKGENAPIVEQDKKGVLLRVLPTSCVLLGPAKEAFEMPMAYADAIRDSELQALAKDVSDRYVRAFRTRKLLLETAQRQGIDLTKLPPLLRGAILNPLFDKL